MAEATDVDLGLYRETLEKITALCKGFLLVADQSIEKACSFCRGILILLQQLLRTMPQVIPAQNPS
ncbi:MAG: hypothetical protein JSW00_10970 [Thermoplasmata archaeon]|nr:MAG: hypothetical protein JSW00_10970 [Thermoplasmata archaeon]